MELLKQILMLLRPVLNSESLPEPIRRTMVEVSIGLFGPKVSTNEANISLGGVKTLHLKRLTADKTILYLHGGGYNWGSPKTHKPLLASLAEKANAEVYLPDYRLAPENPFPAAVEDVVTVYKNLLSRGLDPATITIGGDSAGGGLTLTSLLKFKEEGLPMPAAAFLFSPWTDLTTSGQSHITFKDRDPMLDTEMTKVWADRYSGPEDKTNPLISPVFGDLTGLPPLLIHVGAIEILLDDAKKIHERAQAAGVQSTLKVFPDMFHVFQFFEQYLVEANTSLVQVASFLDKESLIAQKVAAT